MSTVGPGRWLIGAIGMAGIGLGAVLTLRAVWSPRELVSTGAWLLIPTLLSDLVIMPVAAVLGWLVSRRLAPPWQAPVIVGLVLSTFVLLIGWPFIGGFGRQPDNSSLLDRDYVAGALGLLGLIWFGCVLTGVIATVRGRAQLPID